MYTRSQVRVQPVVKDAVKRLGAPQTAPQTSAIMAFSSVVNEFASQEMDGSWEVTAEYLGELTPMLYKASLSEEHKEDAPMAAHLEVEYKHPITDVPANTQVCTLSASDDLAATFAPNIPPAYTIHSLPAHKVAQVNLSDHLATVDWEVLQ